MLLILVFVCLGFGLEALAETFFADLRVRGRQDQEARIKDCASVLGYRYGFASAAVSGCNAGADQPICDHIGRGKNGF